MYVAIWWHLPDLNWGHKALQASALPTELRSQNNINELSNFTRIYPCFQLASGFAVLYSFFNGVNYTRPFWHFFKSSQDL